MRRTRRAPALAGAGALAPHKHSAALRTWLPNTIRIDGCEGHVAYASHLLHAALLLLFLLLFLLLRTCLSTFNSGVSQPQIEKLRDMWAVFTNMRTEQVRARPPATPHSIDLSPHAFTRVHSHACRSEPIN